MSEDADPGPPLSVRRRRARYLVVPLGVWIVATTIGAVLAPALLAHAPLLLLVMSPLTRHLLLVSPSLDTVTFFVASTIGMFLPDPFAFLLGREYGQSAVDWIERRSGGAGPWVRWTHRAFQRAAPVVLFLSPGPFVNLLAGASKMRAWVWLTLNLSGTLAIVVTTRIFGEALAEPIAAVRGFIEANVVALCAVSIVVVGVGALARRRRLRG